MICTVPNCNTPSAGTCDGCVEPRCDEHADRHWISDDDWDGWFCTTPDDVGGFISSCDARAKEAEAHLQAEALLSALEVKG